MGAFSPSSSQKRSSFIRPQNFLSLTAYALLNSSIFVKDILPHSESAGLLTQSASRERDTFCTRPTKMAVPTVEDL